MVNGACRPPQPSLQLCVSQMDMDRALAARPLSLTRSKPYACSFPFWPACSFGRSQMDTSLDEAAAAAVAAGEQLADEKGGEDEAGSPLLVSVCWRQIADGRLLLLPAACLAAYLPCCLT